MAQRPRRERKGDRLLNLDARRAEIATDHAIAPFDRAAREAERKWGVDRLPELVPPAMAAKYGGAIGYLNEAIAADDADKAAAAAQNCIKGLAAMDAAATAAGHQPPQALAQDSVDGWTFRIVADSGEQIALPDDGVPAFTLREVGLALKAWANTPAVEAVKRAFPTAEVVRLPKSTRPPTALETALDDTIPFGSEHPQ